MLDRLLDLQQSSLQIQIAEDNNVPKELPRVQPKRVDTEEDLFEENEVREEVPEDLMTDFMQKVDIIEKSFQLIEASNERTKELMN